MVFVKMVIKTELQTEGQKKDLLVIRAGLYFDFHNFDFHKIAFVNSIFPSIPFNLQDFKVANVLIINHEFHGSND